MCVRDHFTVLTLEKPFLEGGTCLKPSARMNTCDLDFLLEIGSLTVTVVKLRRPPYHAVGLPVPDALHHLLLQHLLPGGGLPWAGVHYRVA